ncbi:MBL fold metallo-hydrolase [Reyranella sp.]|jgi:phosphoribosyl 1,2-cyclic phosphate phosphodiesterase|uniref:MBL fold metallo-hydrolase n=1 Tax=Reyranella sp. TaxID=1929291 RepID=UPI002F92DD1F
MRVTILGCGTSGGVPRVGGAGGLGDWGAADPMDKRNRRTRCSILVQDRGKTVLVDTSPDVRAQLLAARVERVDAVLWTHDHADQCHGIDDLRPYVFRQGQIEAWADERTLAVLRRRFGYCFEAEEGGFYNSLYLANEIQGPFTAGGVPVIPIPLDHGTIPSLGFRFGGFAYVNDVVAMPDAAFDILQGVEVMVVDAMRYRPHPTHAHLDLALEWIGRAGVKRAFLTNLHIDMDYAELNRRTPAHVWPCYDGLMINIDDNSIC